MQDGSDLNLAALAHRVAAALAARGWRLAVAESCTGGWIGKCLTDIPGSSAWFDRGYVTYSDEAKSQLLDVPAELIAAHGAVSGPVAAAMAQGARDHGGTHVALAVTGVAGPGGGSADKPVGTVWFGWAGPGDQCASRVERFSGDREQVRRQAVAAALQGLLSRLGAP